MRTVGKTLQVERMGFVSRDEKFKCVNVIVTPPHL